MFRFILLSLVLNYLVVGYELSSVDANVESRLAEAKARFKELQANIGREILNSPRTASNTNLRENKGPHLTASNIWLASYIATSPSTCGQPGAIYDVYGQPIPPACTPTGNANQWYKVIGCTDQGSSGVNIVSQTYSDADCTDVQGSEYTYFLQNCGDSSATVSYTCFNDNTNSAAPWAIPTQPSTPAGYLISQFSSTDTSCSGNPISYTVLVNGICMNEFEYACPEGKAYSSSTCSGTPYTFALNTGCMQSSSSGSDYNYQCYN